MSQVLQFITYWDIIYNYIICTELLYIYNHIIIVTSIIQLETIALFLQEWDYLIYL